MPGNVSQPMVERTWDLEGNVLQLLLLTRRISNVILTRILAPTDCSSTKLLLAADGDPYRNPQLAKMRRRTEKDVQYDTSAVQMLSEDLSRGCRMSDEPKDRDIWWELVSSIYGLEEHP